jgi:transcriptional regulator with XRE-family HTH domain
MPETKTSRVISGLRAMRGLSAREVARRAKCADMTVRRVESGEQDPSVGLLNRLLDVLEADQKTRLSLVNP